MILQRIEITLVGPDEYPADEGSYDRWLAEERRVKFLFRDHLHIVLRQIKSELPEGFEVEVDSLL